MSKNKRLLLGSAIILAALAYIIYGGMQEAMVYFYAPSELKAAEHGSRNKSIKMGGMVVKGSLQKDLSRLSYRFDLTDGSATLPVFFKGVPPDLFSEGKGAVVEGRMGGDGVFHATTIMAKHAEDYSPHAEGRPINSFLPGEEAAAK